MKKTLSLLTCLLLLAGCQTKMENPLLSTEQTPYGVPQFDKIELKHYEPAFMEAIEQSKKEIEFIVLNPAEPTFENTIVALDRSGSLLAKVEGAFYNVLEADGNDEMDAIAERVTPLITELGDNIMLNEQLFERVKSVYDQRETLGLTPEQMRLLTETYKNFINSGAGLAPEQKERLKEINKELALLSLRFGNNVVAETNSIKRFITNEDELRGLPQSAKDAAREEAAADGHADAWLFTPKRTSFTPVLQYCENRELRRQLLMDYTIRGNRDNENDNKSVINKTMRLRIEKAQLMGYTCPADYILNDCMAHDSKTVNTFLKSVWEPSLAAAKREAAELQKMLDDDIANGRVTVSAAADYNQANLQPWDWWYYSEKLRKQKYDLNEEDLKPYFELSNVRHGVFALATKLYGLQFEPLRNMPVYNLEVEVFKVTDADDNFIGILYTDYFPRAGKRPGAWMNDICSQYVDAEGVDHRPVIINVGNFNKPTKDNPSLLSMDDVETMFHEFGHALHGLMSKAHYRSLSGTNVPRDFVEMPSQFMENFCYEPEIMRTYAKHYQTGEIIPDSLIAKINNAGHFNQGFVETELLSASILDMDYHCLTNADTIDVNRFEQESMTRMGMIPEIIVRYRSTFYNHIFTTGYEAGYYSYTWSAVLDSDAFAAFKETGDITNPEVAKRFRHMLEQGGTRDSKELWLEFRGREVDPKYLLQKKGFIK